MICIFRICYVLRSSAYREKLISQFFIQSLFLRQYISIEKIFIIYALRNVLSKNYVILRKREMAFEISFRSSSSIISSVEMTFRGRHVFLRCRVKLDKLTTLAKYKSTIMY